MDRQVQGQDEEPDCGFGGDLFCGCPDRFLCGLCSIWPLVGPDGHPQNLAEFEFSQDQARQSSFKIENGLSVQGVANLSSTIYET